MKVLVLFVFIFILSICAVRGQKKIRVLQYSSFCEDASLVEGKFLQERLKTIRKTIQGTVQINAVIIRTCGMKFGFTAQSLDGDVFIKSNEITSAVLTFSDQVVSERYVEEECDCAYDVRIELDVDSFRSLSIDNHKLELTEERFKTFPIRYFIYQDDTTGYVDKYGLQQGHYTSVRSNFIVKTFYKDGAHVKCELWDLSGKLVDTDADCHTLLERHALRKIDRSKRK
jgi:hypothetical protein